MPLFTNRDNQGRKLQLPAVGAPVVGPSSAIGGGQQPRPVILDVQTEDDEAVPITIHLGRTIRLGNVPNVVLPQPNDPQYAQAVVVVEWGAAGGVSQVEIDVGLGTTFCVCGSRVKVFALGETSLEDASNTIVTGQPNEARTEITAWASYGTTPCMPPTRTRAMVTIANGGAPLVAGVETGRFLIPAFARRAYGIVAPAAQVVEIRWYRTNAGELVGADLASAVNIIPPPSATYFSIFNAGVVNLNEARVRFELGL